MYHFIWECKWIAFYYPSKATYQNLTISTVFYTQVLNVFLCPTLSFFPLHTPNYETNLSLYTYVTNNLTMHSLVGRTLVGSKKCVYLCDYLSLPVYKCLFSAISALHLTERRSGAEFWKLNQFVEVSAVTATSLALFLLGSRCRFMYVLQNI